ncbi:MAG: hypothetical protein JWL59_184 [Chthoniobacteraceae bacterium]|nr:hypothetical protein [Chthoniobacteraceae bacterium]
MEIATIHAQSRRTYGSPRIRMELRKSGRRIGRRRVARIMKRCRLFGRSRTRRKPRTTDSEHDQPIAPNLLKDREPASAINEVWVTDITYIHTDEHWLYVAAVLDTFSRRIVGWAFGTSLATSLCLEALDMALIQRQPPKGLIHHSDRGVQYASKEYRQALADSHLIPSMSRKANCYDNAMAESFWSTLKTECVDRIHFKTLAEAKVAVFDFIECFYNPQRSHSSIGYLSPIAFKNQIN